jgi:hypothetical protein
VAPVVFTLGSVLALVLAAGGISGVLPPWVWLSGAIPWGCLVLYGVLVLLAAGQLARHQGWRLWPALLIIFPTFHFTYGAGIAWGWSRVLLHRYPWHPEDGIPRWDDVREEPPRLAA